MNVPPRPERNETERRLGTLIGAFLISSALATLFDLTERLAVFALVVVGGTAGLFLIREAIASAVRNRGRTPPPEA